MTMHSFMLIAVLSAIILPTVNGHGMMLDPPNRASRWRSGFGGPREFTDNQLSCGGRNVQWGKHGGKCGACGDEYGIKNPKFTYPGPFARNPPIVKVYTEGDKIDVKIRITANHKGYFVFRIARLVSPPITQEQLNEIMLRLPNGDAEWKLLSSHGNKLLTIPLQLPRGLSCKHCVLQWWWSTGNNHVNDKPESFVNCADIEIRPHNGRPRPSAKPEPTRRPVTLPPRTKPSRPRPTRPGGKVCRSHGRWSSPAMDEWCRNNCALGNCPQSICKCN